MSKNNPTPSAATEVELVFDGNEVTSTWYRPELKDVFCGLCGKKITGDCDELRCTNTNPYCG
jgi:hypothetical protein